MTDHLAGENASRGRALYRAGSAKAVRVEVRSGLPPRPRAGHGTPRVDAVGDGEVVAPADAVEPVGENDSSGSAIGCAGEVAARASGCDDLVAAHGRSRAAGVFPRVLRASRGRRFPRRLQSIQKVRASNTPYRSWDKGLNCAFTAVTVGSV